MSRWDRNLAAVTLTNNSAGMEIIAGAASRCSIGEVSVINNQGLTNGISLSRTGAVGVNPTLVAMEQEDPNSTTVAQANLAVVWTTPPTKSSAGPLRAFDGAGLFWSWPDWELIVVRAASLVLWNEAANTAWRASVTLRE